MVGGRVGRRKKWRSSGKGRRPLLSCSWRGNCHTIIAERYKGEGSDECTRSIRARFAVLISSAKDAYG